MRNKLRVGRLKIELLEESGVSLAILVISHNMNSTIRGRFFFKRTSSGNLLGEFSNRQSDGIYTESADVIGKSDGYVGKYTSTWWENGKPTAAILIISRCRRNPQLFEIIWEQDNKKTFDGEGMLCDDILIGDYYSI